MKIKLSIIFFLIGYLLPITNLYTQETPIAPLPDLIHGIISEEEIRVFGDTTNSRATSFTIPPLPPVRNIAEFEPMEAVLIAYPNDFGVPFSLIVELSRDITVTTLVLNQGGENNVRNMYETNNVNLANCTFVQTPLNSYWTRDCGPWFIADSTDRIAIIDFFYSSSRPFDNAIPQKMSEVLGLDSYYMDITIQGGNYMTDGLGISVSTDRVFDENPSLSLQDVQQIASDYLGVHSYSIIDDPNNTYIKHVDCWGKFLAVDKVLIKQVPQSDSQYNDIEDVADYFYNAISSYGTPYRVYRIYTPDNEPYTNSLIVNNKVFVPAAGTSWDDAAVNTFQQAMPGYQIFSITSNNNRWLSTDALHCRTKGIPDRNMIYIKHIPISGIVDEAVDYEIEADIISYSGDPIYSDSVNIYFSEDDGAFESILMSLQSENTYMGLIPGNSGATEIAYYLSVTNLEGKEYNNPFIGASDPFRYTINTPEVTPEVTPEPTPEVTTEPTPEVTAEPTPEQTPELATGDVDGDGAVNILDAMLTARYYVELPIAVFYPEVADVNYDGFINIIDALLIARHYVGLITLE